jgi:hypothetical protein
MELSAISYQLSAISYQKVLGGQRDHGEHL